VAMLCVLVVGMPTASINAQPASPAGKTGGTAAPSAKALATAGKLYKAAEAAMASGSFDDAARDYGAAYEITKDSLLFFKIASAHDRGGRCPVALNYYRRYLAEGNPAPEFVTLTNQRISACEKPNREKPAPPMKSPAASEPAREPAPLPRPVEEHVHSTSNKRTLAWVATGTSLAFVTVGAVLAIAANSTQADIDDLVATRSASGQPPTFDGTTKSRYDDLIKTGDRSERLSWGAFGLAGAAAATATYLFVTSKDHTESAPTAQVTPVFGRDYASVQATVRF
jgi:hypothetical protein